MSRVLLVTIILIGRSGTEVVCCETARGLRKRGHDVSIYTQQDGPTADGLRAEGFQVVTDLAPLTARPDVIQANQTYPLLEAVGRFPGVPAISICHDSTVWYNEPVDLPVIRRQVAVDFACRDRIANRLVQFGERIDILHNAVDLDRFPQRRPLPAKPKRALIVAKYSPGVDAIRTACAQRGINVDALGPALGHEVDDLPARLCNYDLVFATARSALEALATGCAVIVIDARGLAGLVTSEAVPSWRQNNFGLRLLSRAVSAEAIAEEIDRYDPVDARLASDFVRQNSSLDRYLDRLEEMHREVIAESAAAPIDKDLLLYRMGQATRGLATAQVAQNEVDWATASRARELELRREFHERAFAREAELRAEFQDRTDARDAALRAEFQIQAHRREAEFQTQFQAYREWVAPRNAGRRMMHKVRRVLSGT